MSIYIFHLLGGLITLLLCAYAQYKEFGEVCLMGDDLLPVFILFLVWPVGIFIVINLLLKDKVIFRIGKKK